MQNLIKETKFILDKYNIKANKNLGQNFLIDENVVDSIIDAANISNNDLIIEIGPGLGTLTKKLLEQSKKVICIELDSRMISILNDRFKLYNNIEIINDDVLNVNLKQIIEREKSQQEIQEVKIVANLPYYITTPIVMKLLEDKLDIESITIMIQKEVADRLVSKPGEQLSGAISYAISYYTKPEKILYVPKEAFLPSPEVNSEVIKLNILEKPPVEVENEKLFFKIIKLSFMQRRKTLVNALYNGKLMENKEDIENMLNQLSIDTKIRGEKLTLSDFSKITNFLIKTASQK